MTVTRKDLNAIAATFNQRLLLHHSKFSSPDWNTFAMAEEMYVTLKKLNPNVSLQKWHKAVTEGCPTIINYLKQSQFVEVQAKAERN